MHMALVRLLSFFLWLKLRNAVVLRQIDLQYCFYQKHQKEAQQTQHT
jgi:hypothetical protein